MPVGLVDGDDTMVFGGEPWPSLAEFECVLGCDAGVGFIFVFMFLLLKISFFP